MSQPSANTPPLSEGSSTSPTTSAGRSSSGRLPDYDLATATSRTTTNSASEADRIADTLQRASLKLCNGPKLTNAEKREVQQALSEGVKVGLSHCVGQLCVVQDLKDHLKLLNLFDRLRQAVRDGTEYFDYPSCQQGDAHIDEHGLDAPPPPYAPNVAAAPISVSEKPSLDPRTAEKSQKATQELKEQLVKDGRWEIYLNRAAYRLEVWLAKILQVEYKARNLIAFSEKDAEDMPDHILPPIDVALVLHAYHLNPLFKREDSVRLRNRDGLSLFHYPLHQLAQRAHPTLPIFIDVDSARAHWIDKITETRTNQQWDLPLQPPTGTPSKNQVAVGGSTFGLRVGCPRCRFVQYVPWNGVGKAPIELGIGESGWERKCLNQSGDCNQTLSAQHLQMRRFIDDFQRWRTSAGKNVKSKTTGLTKPAFFMAGTQMNPFTGELNTKDMLGEILLSPVFRNERTQPATRYLVRKAKSETDLVDIEIQASECGYHLPTFRKWLEDRTFGPLVVPRVQSSDGIDQLRTRIALMMRPYDHGNASAYGEGLFDLVAAVKRQSGFNEEMAGLGWSTHLELVDRGVLDDMLSRSLIRYHKFLDLLSLNFYMLSPTLDIDLCWHTHQLKQSYTQDMISYVGRFINHDDAVETGTLKESFDRTAQLWKEKYSQPYSLCGCIYNNPGTMKKLKSLLGSGKGDEAQEGTGGSGWTSKMKGKWRAAKDLPGDKGEENATVWQDATHPSAHSAVVVKEEEHKHDKLRLEMVKEWSLGKRREGHQSAFVFEFNNPGLYPFSYSPLVNNSHYVSRGASGDATINAYTLYGVYGLMAMGSSAGLASLAFAGTVGAGAFSGAGAFGVGGFDCGGSGGGCGGGGGGCGGGGGGC